MELLMGVPVANTTPLPPLISLIYWHFISMSMDFLARVLDIPATLRHFGKNRTVFVVVRLIHKHAINAKLLKVDDIILPALIHQPF
jgi:hypothetical protein